MNYTDLAKKVLSLVGGNENVSSLQPCSTRLRFKLNDMSVVDYVVGGELHE